MLAPRATRAQRAHRSATITKRVLVLLDVLALLDSIDDVDAPTKKRRSTLVLRERRPFATYIRPMLQDRTFSMRFRMGYDDFMALVDLVRPAVKRDEEMGLLRNGTIPVEYQVAMTLRWLAGGSIYECMDGHVIARSTAYCLTSRVISALNACPELNCKWPEDDDVARAAGLFRKRSSFGIIMKCVGAMDGLFIRLIKPNATETAEPNSYYSGHKKGFGMNFQVRCCRACMFFVLVICWCSGARCPSPCGDLKVPVAVFPPSPRRGLTKGLGFAAIAVLSTGLT